MAAGVPVEEAFLAACMDKRRARGDGLSTPRVEGDAVQFLSGVVNGRTTGTAIALMIENQNTRSGDYAKTADLLRPGHADYTAYAKYHAIRMPGARPLFGPRHRRAGGGRRFWCWEPEPGRDRDRDAHRAVCRDQRCPLCAG